MLCRNYPHADVAPTYARKQKTSLGPLLLTPPFAEGSNPGPFATFRTTQPLGHTWPGEGGWEVQQATGGEDPETLTNWMYWSGEHIWAEGGGGKGKIGHN